MSEYQLAMIAYVLLQVGSLILLPRWWKVAAIPALWIVPTIIKERYNPGYMSDVFVAMFAIFTCAYLGLVWLVFGIVRFIQSRWRTE